MSDLMLLQKSLEAYPVISFDVFDTLVTRVLWRPEDVFHLISRKIGDESFVKKRIVAQLKARAAASKEHQYEDITIQEIYADPELTDSIDLELEIERSVCVGNPEMLAVLVEAQKLNKKIIAISDMYLPKSFIRELLDRFGFSEIEEIYVSSEERKLKVSGRLFSHVLSELDIGPEDLLHIGDNAHADVAAPKKLGIAAFHYPSPQKQLLDSARINPAIVKALAKDGGLEASLLAGLFATKHLNPVPEDSSYWRDTGYFVAGPLAYAFTAWIACRAAALKLERIFFLARDGALPSKIYETYFAGIASEYVYASQRMFFVPSIKNLDAAAIDYLTIGDINVPAREYFSRLGIGMPDGLEQDLEQLFGDPMAVIGSKEQIGQLGQLFRKHENWFTCSAEAELELLLAYLKSVGFADAKRKAIVDIGWLGSTQRSLENLPVATDNLHGLYFGLGPRGYDNCCNEGFAFSYGAPSSRYAKVFKCAEYFELLFSADHYATSKIRATSDGLDPQFEAGTQYEDERLAIAKDIHLGALEFCAEYVALARELNLADLAPDLAMIAADAVLSNPTDLDIQMIGNVHHSKGIGSAKYYPIIPQDRLFLAGWCSFIFGGKDLTHSMSYWAVGYRHSHKIFRKFRLLGLLLEKSMWLPKKIKKARMLGVKGTVVVALSILKRKMKVIS